MATTTIPALTTVFTPPASCLTDIYNLTYSSGGSPWIYLQLGPTPTSNDCYPSDFTPTPSAFYSPGICPSGYQMACSSIVNINSISETRATCCPSAYTCQTEGGNVWPWYSTELCTLAATTTGTFLVTAEPSVTSTYVGTPKFNAYGIQIRWQLDNPPTQTSHTSTITSTSSILSQSNTSTPVPTPTNPGLSTAAKAGIGIGIGLGALFIFIGVALVYFYRRRKRSANMSNSTDLGLKQQLPNPNIYEQAGLGNNQREFRPFELDSRNMPAELSSG